MIVILNDVKLLNGEILFFNSMLIVSKFMLYMKLVKFFVVDFVIEKWFLINGMESVNVLLSMK